MSNTIQQEYNSLEIWNKISYLSELRGQTVSSMVTLIIPPKYCI